MEGPPLVTTGQVGLLVQAVLGDTQELSRVLQEILEGSSSIAKALDWAFDHNILGCQVGGVDTRVGKMARTKAQNISVSNSRHSSCHEGYPSQAIGTLQLVDQQQLLTILMKQVQTHYCHARLAVGGYKLIAV